MAVTHIHLALNVDFNEKKLKGRADLTIDRRNQETSQLVVVLLLKLLRSGDSQTFDQA